MFDQIDRQIISAADPRYGVVRRTSLLSLGLSASAIDRRVRSGSLVPVMPGIYRLSARPASWRSELFAAWLWGGDGALVRGLSLAALFGFEGFPPGPLQIYTTTGKSSEGVDVARLRAGSAETMPFRWVDGMKTTTVERMLFDLCSLVPPSRAGSAVDEALIRRLTAIPRLRAEQEGMSGRPGARRFGALLDARDDRDGRVRSEMERRMLRILRRIETHRLVADYEVLVVGRRYVLDFAFPDLKIGIECHSFKWHAGGAALRQDSERHRHLVMAGWTILYYTWEDIVLEPERVLAEVERLLGSSLLP